MNLIRLEILVSILVFFSFTYATILRLSCLGHADFSIIHQNKALKGHVIAKHSGITDIQCTVKCVEHHKCRSYNININSGERHLNSKALGDAGTELLTETGWVYKSTDYNETMVGETCMKLKPCPSGILCKDTCKSPFYECLFCDKKHTGLHCDIRIDGDECAESPCKSSGTCVDKYADFECNCLPGYIGKNCETDIDECENIPCLNGGTCINLVNKFQCQCLAGYTGQNCATDFDECHSNPCLNDGSCVDKLNGYTCNCKPGTNGTHCETDINECASLPCMNGGNCTNLLNKFTCQCPAGYTGLTCATDFDECYSKPCLNDGSCVDKLNGYICNCKPGTTGTHCETDINECASLPCMNGGNCINLLNKFQCQCPAGYTGLTCATDIDECGSKPCMNGGTCNDKLNGYECQCLPAYTGEKCQEVKIDLQSQYVGCYKDGSPRALPSSGGGMKIHDVIGITKQCIKACRTAGHPYAGLQWYAQCHCGTTYNSHGVAPESDCNTPCSDSFGRKCGGSWRNSVYKTS